MDLFLILIHYVLWIMNSFNTLTKAKKGVPLYLSVKQLYIMAGLMNTFIIIKDHILLKEVWVWKVNAAEVDIILILLHGG